MLSCEEFGVDDTNAKPDAHPSMPKSHGAIYKCPRTGNLIMACVPFAHQGKRRFSNRPDFSTAVRVGAGSGQRTQNMERPHKTHPKDLDLSPADLAKKIGGVRMALLTKIRTLLMADVEFVSHLPPGELERLLSFSSHDLVAALMHNYKQTLDNTPPLVGTNTFPTTL